MSKRTKSGMSGRGYYIALGLCAVAIGISGYLYYANQKRPASPQETNPAVEAAEATEGQEVAAVATKPAEIPESKSESKRALKSAAPVSGETVAEYAVDCLSYNETTRDWRTHDGVDLAADAGTEVKAAAEGTVYTVYEDDTMGNTVVIKHQDGYTTKYASLAADVPVKPGQKVELGQTIGCVGSTAILESALGDHVHFCVTHNDEIMDPMEFLSME